MDKIGRSVARVRITQPVKFEKKVNPWNFICRIDVILHGRIAMRTEQLISYGDTKIRVVSDSKSRLNKRTLTTIAIIAIVIVAGTYFGLVYFFQTPCPSGTTLRSFTIIANDTTGYNNSRSHPFLMNTQKGDCVLINFVNDSGQPHGLAINNYVTGIIVQPGQTYTVRFQATKIGQFQAHEQIPSTINAWTDNCGTLSVT